MGFFFNVIYSFIILLLHFVRNINAYFSGKVDVTTSPIKKSESIYASKIQTSGKLTIDQCKSGDQVLVIWDQSHENFRILQQNKHMYFLHLDSMEALNLEIVDGKPNKFYCVGEVVDKEYCHARKVREFHSTKIYSRTFLIEVGRRSNEK